MSAAAPTPDGKNASARPRLRGVVLVAGLVLALVAVRLQAQLWELPGDLTPAMPRFMTTFLEAQFAN